jgi:hypothetical protein
VLTIEGIAIGKSSWAASFCNLQPGAGVPECQTVGAAVRVPAAVLGRSAGGGRRRAQARRSPGLPRPLRPAHGADARREAAASRHQGRGRRDAVTYCTTLWVRHCRRPSVRASDSRKICRNGVESARGRRENGKRRGESASRRYE